MAGTLIAQNKPNGGKGAGYVVILICDEIDHFKHNIVFAAEIAEGLCSFGMPSRIVDYRRDIRQVKDALADHDCAFLICFNGFGAELCIANRAPGDLISAFQSYGKPLFDLMHDCPSHESMAHQMHVLHKTRRLLLTDHGYIQEAHELGVPDVRFVSSITFPLTLPEAARTAKQRPVEVLLPMQLAPLSWIDNRYVGYVGEQDYRTRIFRDIYQAVSERCVADLGIDPRVETRRACREADIAFDARDADHRFLMTTILDHVKIARRRNLVAALRRLPVTLISRGHEEDDIAEGVSVVPARSFRELLALMAESVIVLCPLPHMTGFHERALGAFTAGAAVVSAPNEIIETNFEHGENVLIYRSAEELAGMLPELLADPDRLRDIAARGQRAALARFSPGRLAATMLASWRLDPGRPAT